MQLKARQHSPRIFSFKRQLNASRGGGWGSFCYQTSQALALYWMDPIELSNVWWHCAVLSQLSSETGCHVVTSYCGVKSDSVVWPKQKTPEVDNIAALWLALDCASAALCIRSTVQVQLSHWAVLHFNSLSFISMWGSPICIYVISVICCCIAS